MKDCEHLEALTEADFSPLPPRVVCEDCIREGTQWVELRQCLECGHVGCCDSSPRRHATAHFKTTKHPVVRSAMPGDTWTWCYVDSLQGDLVAVPAGR